MQVSYSPKTFSEDEEPSVELATLSQLCHKPREQHPQSDEQSIFATGGFDEWADSEECNWMMHPVHEPIVSSPPIFDDEEEVMDACMPHLYDPTLFSDLRYSLSMFRPPQSPATRSQWGLSNEQNKKPLPEIPRPSLVRTGIPDAPPPSPCVAHAADPIMHFNAPAIYPTRTAPTISLRRSSPNLRKNTPTPPASPLSHTTTFSHPSQPSNATTHPPSKPRSTPVQRHATYPSISSTLELLEERETPVEKRSGVLVTDPPFPINVQPSLPLSSRARSASAGVLRISTETAGSSVRQTASGSRHPRKQRPALPMLATSNSSPQLRTLAALATGSSGSSTGADTLRVSPRTPSTSSVSSGSPVFASNVPLCSEHDTDENAPQLASRWSIDSVAPRSTIDSAQSRSGTPLTSPTSGNAQSGTGRKRDRLISFITRGRSGSLGKVPPGLGTSATDPAPNLPSRPSSHEKEREKDLPVIRTSPRPSLSHPLPPVPIAMSASSLSSSTSSSAASSNSDLPTPADVYPQSERDSVSPASPTSPTYGSSGSSSFPSDPLQYDDSAWDRPPSPSSPPPEPTLPLPSPSTPSASFLLPQTRPTSFFSSLALKRRRKKVLIISGVPYDDVDGTTPDADAEAIQRRRRYERVLRWCQNFGEIRKVERKGDGSIYIHWREWEVADRVCRVQAQVYIKEVGRVNLAWHYIN